MSTITAETLAIMEQLPEADQQLALNLVRQVLNAWLIDNELPNQETIAALREGTDEARRTAAATLADVKHAMKIDYFEGWAEEYGVK